MMMMVSKKRMLSKIEPKKQLKEKSENLSTLRLGRRLAYVRVGHLFSLGRSTKQQSSIQASQRPRETATHGLMSHNCKKKLLVLLFTFLFRYLDHHLSTFPYYTIL